MPTYFPIKRWMDAAEKVRTAERLLALRQKLKSEITDRAGRNSLLIATWNLRDFDSNRLGHGPRLRESHYYIAEIISAFDLIALQEISRNLEALETVLSILGPGLGLHRHRYDRGQERRRRADGFPVPAIQGDVPQDRRGNRPAGRTGGGAARRSCRSAPRRRVGLQRGRRFWRRSKAAASNSISARCISAMKG